MCSQHWNTATHCNTCVEFRSGLVHFVNAGSRTFVNESCHKYEWVWSECVLSQIWMSHSYAYISWVWGYSEVKGMGMRVLRSHFFMKTHTRKFPRKTLPDFREPSWVNDTNRVRDSLIHRVRDYTRVLGGALLYGNVPCVRNTETLQHAATRTLRTRVYLKC